MIQTETWRDIPGYEGLYQVSNQGQVKRLAGSPRCKKDRILKPQKHSEGYSSIALSKGGTVTGFLVHSLVCLAFIGPRPDGLEVNHINGIRTDNFLENLEYVTPAENLRHAVESGLISIGESSPNSKLTESDVREIRRLLSRGVRQRFIADSFSVNQMTISRINTGVLWSHVS